MKKSITGCFKAVSSWLESFHNILTLYLRTAKDISTLPITWGWIFWGNIFKNILFRRKAQKEGGRKGRKKGRKEGSQSETLHYKGPGCLACLWRQPEGVRGQTEPCLISQLGGKEKSILQDRAFQVSCKEDRLAAGAGLRVLKTSSVPSPYPLQVAGLGMALHCRTTLPASSQWDVSVGILFLLLQESSVGLLALD